MALRMRDKRPRPRSNVRRHVNEMRRLASYATESRDPRDPRPAPSPPWWSTVFSSRYKTEMCHHLVEEGVCSFGEGCVYAHSVHELRPLKRHPKHRSELCKDYHQDGYCSFGTRCSFIHTKPDLEELKAILEAAPKGPMPENPSCTQRDSESASLGYRSSSTSSTPEDAGSPQSRPKKRRVSHGSSRDSDFCEDIGVLPPLLLKPTLLDSPLEPGFRRRWARTGSKMSLWKELPRRRLAIFEELCPQNCCRSQSD